MKTISFMAVALLTIALALSIRMTHSSMPEPAFVPYDTYLQSKIAIGCSPSSAADFDWRYDEPSIPLLRGWGNFTWNVTAANDSARIYFNQGISMYYSFHMIEAKASFAKAARFDPDCAMALWGLAMAYGVNYNYAMLQNAPEAMDAMAKAQQAVNNESALEKALVGTLAARYSSDTSVSRKQQNADYELAIKGVLDKFPNDANLYALYADALMVQHPWDMYDIEGKPKPWTPAIVAVLEKALANSPMHPSLNHLYIHAMEGGVSASKALPSAWRLSTMMPMVSHMVHMPSHIFIRTGHYKEGMQVNDSSINGFNDYYAQFPEVEGDAFLYLVHNLHMKAACTLYRGNAKEAYDAALQLQASVPAKYMEMAGGMGNYLQYAYSTPVIAQVRFGWWDSLIAAPRVSSNLKNAWAIQAFGKGMAYARKDDNKNAAKMLADLQSLAADPSMREQFETINPAHKALAIMTALLQGAIAMSEDNFGEAEVYYRKAVNHEDDLAYQEPRDWLLPTRHYLGVVLLRQQKFAAASKIFGQELVINPGNVWSLHGLMTAQKLAGQDNASAATQQLFRKAAEGSDIKLTSSAF